MSDSDDAPSSQIGGINISRLDKTEFSAQTITSHVEAGGHIAGRDVAIYNYYYHTQTTVAPSPPGEAASAEDLPNPYRGLYHFGPGDAHLFFGRETYTDLLVERVETSGRRLVAVVGASGSGKSSVVLAGLAPRLQSIGGWQFTHFRPGNEPMLALANALAPLFTPDLDSTDQLVQARKLAVHFQEGSLPLSDVVSRIEAQQPQQRLLLIADQFEELYTLCPDEATRRRFLDLLLAQLQQPATRLTLILTLRADFMGHTLSYRPLAEALQDADLKLGPMNRAEQERAIVRPAAHYGVTFEGGLVERILAEVREEPGRLPLLEFALTLLWERRQGRQLTHAAYEALGGVEGALANHADRQFAGLSPEAQAQARRIFVQLVHPGQGVEDTRRLATLNELGRETWPLVKQLADARLVVTSRSHTEQETAEVIHEALIRRWQTLRGWLEEDRAFRVWQDRLRVARDQWQASKQDPGALLRGVPLAEAAQMLAERIAEISPDEQAFIRASLAERDREEQERRHTRQKLTWAAVTVALVIIGLLGLGFWLQSQNAAQQAILRAKAEAELNFYQATDPAARLVELSKLFSRPELDSQARARTLFFGLRRVEQLGLLGVTDKPEELALVSRAILPNLADINGIYYTSDYLTTLQESLADIGLQTEIEGWLAAREAAQAEAYDTAIALYTDLLETNDKNPALWFERGRLLARQGPAAEALADFSEVMALAQGPEYQRSGALPAGPEFATTEQMGKAVARMIMVYPELAIEVEGNGDNYPNLSEVRLPTLKTDEKGVEMVLIPEGSFNMGSNSANAGSEEQPVHKVELDEFYIDRYEVTNAQFVDFLKDQGNQEEGGVPWLSEVAGYSRISAAGDGWQIERGYDTHPVTGVSWYGANAYCSWRGRGGQLPTEAQWEKAARGNDERTYPWGEEVAPHLARYNSEDTTPIGDYAEGISLYGVHDMAGNAWEWVADAYDGEYYKRSLNRNPAGPEDEQNISSKVLRGGSWSVNDGGLRASSRSYYYPGGQVNYVGFRCAQSGPE